MQNHRRTPPVSLPAFTPVPRRHKRQDGWTAQRQRDFIAALADTGSVKHACARVGMASEGAYQLRRAKGAEEFAAAWLAALDHGIRQLEDIALERAIHGVETPVYSYGKLVGTRTVYNDRLIMFMLRNRAMDRFPGAPRISESAKQAIISEARAQWDEEQAHHLAGATDRARVVLREVRARLLANKTDEEAEFRRWHEAKAQGLAVILPERGEGEEPTMPAPAVLPPDENQALS